MNQVEDFTAPERNEWHAYAAGVLPWIGGQLTREELEQYATWKLKAKTRLMLDRRGVRYSGLVIAVCHHDEHGDALPHDAQHAHETAVWIRFLDTTTRKEQAVIASKRGVRVSRKQADDVVAQLWETLNDYIRASYPL